MTWRPTGRSLTQCWQISLVYVCAAMPKMRARAKQEVKSLLFARALVHCDNKPLQIGFNHAIKWHFQFYLVNVSELSRDATLVTRYLTPLISAFLKPMKRIYPNITKNNLQTWVKVVILLLTPMIAIISHERCRGLAWYKYCDTISPSLHKILHRAYAALFK